MIVCLLKSSLMIRCIVASVLISTLLVGSSNMRTLPFRNIALARQKSCFWPIERKFVSMTTSNASSPPPPAFLDIVSQSETLLRAQIISASVARRSGSAFSLTLPVKRKGSCVRQVIFWRMRLRGKLERSWPSRIIRPALRSKRRRMERMKELLPLLKY